MRTAKITIELPQSAEFAADLVQRVVTEQNPLIKQMLEDILEQLRRDYAKNGI